MPDLSLYVPKAFVFQRLVKSAISAANNIDQGTEINDAHAFALLEFLEFLAPEQLTPLMGPGLAAEISAIIESEFSWAALSERTPVQNLLCTHAWITPALSHFWISRCPYFPLHKHKKSQ